MLWDVIFYIYAKLSANNRSFFSTNKPLNRYLALRLTPDLKAEETVLTSDFAVPEHTSVNRVKKAESANSIALDDATQNEPPHLDLSCSFCSLSL